jgi:hypothetical protein
LATRPVTSSSSTTPRLYTSTFAVTRVAYSAAIKLIHSVFYLGKAIMPKLIHIQLLNCSIAWLW